MRHVNAATGIAPFRLAECADLGDCPINPINVEDTLRRVETFVRDLRDRGIVPLAAGGDHLVSLPILRGLAGEPLGMVHFDSHTDTWDRYFGGERFTHGTPFRRAIEEQLLDPHRVIQIGIRGTVFDYADLEWGRTQGVRVVSIDEWRDLGPERTLDEVRRVVGTGPAYLSFDIDVIDPAFAPGTGTPEIGGMFPHEAQRMLRGLRGLDLVGADLVEVSPPFDPSGQTALVGASLMFEILCLLAERVAARRPDTEAQS
jgi:guanidinopropionase